MTDNPLGLHKLKAVVAVGLTFGEGVEGLYEDPKDAVYPRALIPPVVRAFELGFTPDKPYLMELVGAWLTPGLSPGVYAVAVVFVQ